MLGMIVAADLNRAIGFRGQLPWTSPTDMAHFRSVTVGHALIMGRKTWESVGLLQDRRIVVLTSQKIDQPDVISAGAPESAFEQACDHDPHPLVVGGAMVYAAMMPYVSRVWWTQIEATHRADTFIAPLEPRFRMVESWSGHDDGTDLKAGIRPLTFMHFVDASRINGG